MPSEIKAIGDFYRVLLCEQIPLDTPFSLYIFVTNYCNFKCNYCAHSLPHEAMKEKYDFDFEHMSMETFKVIIEQLKKFPRKLKVISLTGQGEPLLNKDLADMVKLAKESNVTERVEFISNASVLTKELSKKLIDAGLDCIRISLQGLNSKKYEEVCEYKLDFDEFVANIAYLHRIKENCDIFVKVMDIALEPGEDEKFYNIFRDISDRMYVEECRPVYDGVQMTDGIAVNADRYGREHEPRLVCPLCFFMLGVLPNGDVKPCDAIYKPMILGNVNEKNMKDMWDGKKLNDFRLMQLQKKRKSHKGCDVCCAPDDVSHPEDQLDVVAEKISKKLKDLKKYSLYG